MWWWMTGKIINVDYVNGIDNYSSWFILLITCYFRTNFYNVPLLYSSTFFVLILSSSLLFLEKWLQGVVRLFVDNSCEGLTIEDYSSIVSLTLISSLVGIDMFIEIDVR